MINLQGITKSFQNGEESIQILHGIDVTLNQEISLLSWGLLVLVNQH